MWTTKMPTVEPLTDTLYRHCEVCSDNNLTVAVWTGPPLLVSINHPPLTPIAIIVELRKSHLTVATNDYYVWRGDFLVRLWSSEHHLKALDVLPNHIQWLRIVGYDIRGLINGYQRLGRTYCLHFQVLWLHCTRNGVIKVSNERVTSIFRDYDRVNGRMGSSFK
jgi:hypothetical protein